MRFPSLWLPFNQPRPVSGLVLFPVFPSVKQSLKNVQPGLMALRQWRCYNRQHMEKPRDFLLKEMGRRGQTHFDAYVVPGAENVLDGNYFQP